MSWWGVPAGLQSDMGELERGRRKKRGGRNREWYEATMFKGHSPLHSWYSRPESRR